MFDRNETPREIIHEWLLELSRGPFVLTRGYFDRLQSSIDYSAPVPRFFGCR